jgi:hypothetical protein
MSKSNLPLIDKYKGVTAMGEPKWLAKVRHDEGFKYVSALEEPTRAIRDFAGILLRLGENPNLDDFEQRNLCRIAHEIFVRVDAIEKACDQFHRDACPA